MEESWFFPFNDNRYQCIIENIVDRCTQMSTFFSQLLFIPFSWAAPRDNKWLYGCNLVSGLREYFLIGIFFIAVVSYACICIPIKRNEQIPRAFSPMIVFFSSGISFSDKLCDEFWQHDDIRMRFEEFLNLREEIHTREKWSVSLISSVSS